MNIGAIIQYYRTKKGFTQKKLAEGICSVSYLSKIENETIEPKEDVAEMLFNRLDVNYQDIAHHDNQKIIHKILKLNKRINEKEYDSAYELIQELKRILTPFHATEALSLFQLIHFHYNIQIRNTKEVDRISNDVFRLEEKFAGENLYLYNKIIGLYYNYLAYPNKAITYFEKAKTLAEHLSIKDPEIYYLLAVSLSLMQKPAQSNYYCQMAKDQFETDFLYTNVTDCYILFGINYMVLEAYEVAERYYLQVLNAKPMGDLPHVRFRVYHNLSILYYYMNRYDEAIKYINLTVKDEDIAYEKIQSLYVQAKIYYLKGKTESAIEYVEKGERALKETKYLKYQYHFYILKHQIHNNTRNPQFLTKVKKVILPYLMDSGEKKMVRELYQMLGDLSYEDGAFQEAADYYKYLANQFNQIKDDL